AHPQIRVVAHHPRPRLRKPERPILLHIPQRPPHQPQHPPPPPPPPPPQRRPPPPQPRAHHRVPHRPPPFLPLRASVPQHAPAFRQLIRYRMARIPKGCQKVAGGGPAPPDRGHHSPTHSC